MPVVVRARVQDDLPALVAQLARVQVVDGYPVHAEHVTAQWLCPPDAVGAWSAERGGAPVGQAVLRQTDRGLEVARLFVGLDARGSGAAAALLATVEEAAAGRPLSLEVATRAAAAIAAYERRGWVRTDEHEAAWREADGTPARAYRYLFPG